MVGRGWSLANADMLSDGELRDYIWELSYALAEAKDKMKERGY